MGEFDWLWDPVMFCAFEEGIKEILEFYYSLIHF